MSKKYEVRKRIVHEGYVALIPESGWTVEIKYTETALDDDEPWDICRLGQPGSHHKFVVGRNCPILPVDLAIQTMEQGERATIVFPAKHANKSGIAMACCDITLVRIWVPIQGG